MSLDSTDITLLQTAISRIRRIPRANLSDHRDVADLDYAATILEGVIRRNEHLWETHGPH